MTALTFGDLAAAATIGLTRRPFHVTGLAGPAGGHVAVLDAGDRAAALLDAAALLTAAGRAGALPAPGIAIPAPAGVDTAPELPARAADVLERGHVPGPVLADLLMAAAARGYRAPAPLLPALLDAAAKDPGLRQAVAMVLGSRGWWLAGHRRDWQQVLAAAAAGLSTVAAAGPGAHSLWETGSREDRLAYLTTLRDRDPGAARELLAAGWRAETGADRARLLAVLAHRLSAADEEFLEAALDDRMAPVAAAAARLLGRLPGAALGHRAAARTASLLVLERHGRRRRLLVTLPGRADAAAVRDGIGTSPPPGVGARSWLLTQLVAGVPLAEWAERFGLDARQLVSLSVVRHPSLVPAGPQARGTPARAAQAGDFTVDVHAGWRLAAIGQASPEWVEALLAAGEPAAASRRPAAAWPRDRELAAVLCPTARAARAARLLAKGHVGAAAIAEVASCPGPWPTALADAAIARLSSAASAGPAAGWPATLAAAAARGLPVTGRTDHAATLIRLAAGCDGASPWLAALRQAARTLTVRRTFLEEIS